MHEGCPRRDFDGLIGRVQIHTRRLCRHEGLAARHQVGSRQIVCHNFQDRGAPKFARMQDTAPHGFEQRSDPLEGVPVTARKDRDISCFSPMAAPRNRAIHRRATLRHDLCPQPVHFGCIRRRHLHPDFTRRHRGQHFCHHSGRCCRGRQAGDHRIACTHHIQWGRSALRTARHEVIHPSRVQITDRKINPIAQQRAGQLTAHIAKANESNFQFSNSF